MFNGLAPLKLDRVEKFKELLTLMEGYKRKNQYQ